MRYTSTEYEEAMEHDVYCRDEPHRTKLKEISYWFTALDAELKCRSTLSVDLVERCLEEIAYLLDCDFDMAPLNVLRKDKVLTVDFSEQKAAN